MDVPSPEPLGMGEGARRADEGLFLNPQHPLDLCLLVLARLRERTGARSPEANGKGEGQCPALNPHLSHFAKLKMGPFLLPQAREDANYIPNIRLICAGSVLPAAKSSNALPVVWIIWCSMNGAPSAAPWSEDFKQHSHSKTAHES